MKRHLSASQHRPEQAGLAGLKQIPLFSRLPEAHLAIIAAQCRERRFPADTTILNQTDEGFDLYLILSGRVKVTLMNEDGREVVLDTLADGDFFGELSVLDNKPRSASITTLTDATMLILTQESLFATIKKHPDIAINLLSVMAKRLRKADEIIESLAFLDVAGRVAKTLLELAQTQGEKMPDGRIRMQTPTHQAIANRIGSSREAVTKAFRPLIDSGFITLQGKDVILVPDYDII